MLDSAFGWLELHLRDRRKKREGASVRVRTKGQKKEKEKRMGELGEIDKGVGGCEQTEERERLRDTDDYREKERENGVTEIVGNGVR